jgi:hypothetical protein
VALKLLRGAMHRPKQKLPTCTRVVPFYELRRPAPKALQLVWCVFWLLLLGLLGVLLSHVDTLGGDEGFLVQNIAPTSGSASNDDANPTTSPTNRTSHSCVLCTQPQTRYTTLYTYSAGGGVPELAYDACEAYFGC